MTYETKLTPISPATDEARRAAAAERMRLYRERRQAGVRCVTVELYRSEIRALMRKGLLDPEMRHDLNAVRDALYALFDRTLKLEE